MFNPVSGSTTCQLRIWRLPDDSYEVVGSMTVEESFKYIATHDLPIGEYQWSILTDDFYYAWDDEYDLEWGDFVGYAVSSDDISTESWLHFDGSVVTSTGPWSKD